MIADIRVPYKGPDHPIIFSYHYKYEKYLRDHNLIDPEKAAKLDELMDQVAKDTILWEILQMVRTYWRDCGGAGQGGAVDLKA